MIELASLILGTVITFLVALVVIVKNSRSITNNLFMGLAVGLIGWSITSYFSLHTSSPSQTLFWIRFIMFFVVIQNTSFYLLVKVFPANRSNIFKQKRYIAAVLYSVITAAVALSPYLFMGFVNGSPIPGPGMALFLPHALFFALGGLISLIVRYRRARGLLKAQLQYFLAGTLLMFTLVPLSNFILPVLLKENRLVIFSPLYAIIFSGLTAYAIVTKKLFDIRAIVARSAAYALLLPTLAGMYIATLLALSAIFFQGKPSQLLTTSLAIVLAITFQPLRRFFEQGTDRIFFRDRYDSQVVLDNFSKILVTEIELGEMLNKSLRELCTDMRISFGQLIIFNDDNVYKIGHYGHLPSRLMVAPQLKRLNHSILVADELEGGERKALMDDHGIRVSVMLRTRDEVVGYLLLGDKLSGDIYSQEDVELLQIVAKELAVAAQNAKAYAEIQEFNITLQERVAHATNRLRVANRHLKELDQAKDEFISMASHQLRTPLTTIKGYLSMMLEGDAGEITPTQKQFTGYAFEGADRMVNLIADLLNVSRLSAGRFMIEAKPSDIVKIVEDEVRQLQSHAIAKKLQLTYHPPKRAIPMIPLDDNKTRQVIMNFVDNAIYYTKEGSITVAVTKVDNAVRVTVKDTGIGVPLDSRRKLFSKFYRAGNAQTVRPDGTGLGLYLAKRVIEDQGGTIIFESVEGKGSTFGFDLPIAASPAAKLATKKAST
jgi:signal transduction histidine kinase